MGFGVFRRRPDYPPRPRRLVFGVAVVAAVGPTLYVRPQPPRQDPVRYELYQRRRVLPPSVAAAAPSVSVPLRNQTRPENRRPIDFQVYRRRLVVPTAPIVAVTPQILRPRKIVVSRELFGYPYFRPRNVAVLGVGAAPADVGLVLRPPVFIRTEPARRQEFYQRVRRVPVTWEAPAEVPALLRAKPPLLIDGFVRPYDYSAYRGRRLPITWTAPDPPATSQSLSRGLYDWKRGLYHGEYTPAS